MQIRPLTEKDYRTPESNLGLISKKGPPQNSFPSHWPFSLVYLSDQFPKETLFLTTTRRVPKQALKRFQFVCPCIVCHLSFGRLIAVRVRNILLWASCGHNKTCSPIRLQCRFCIESLLLPSSQPIVAKWHNFVSFLVEGLRRNQVINHSGWGQEFRLWDERTINNCQTALLNCQWETMCHQQ